MTFSETLTVRYRDTDSQGHMFFANYQVFADEVAGNYLKSLGFDWSNPESLPTYVFTANATCDYIHECHTGDEVRVSVAYERIGRSSATMGFLLTRVGDEQRLAKGSFTQVFVDPQTRKPVPVPDAVREALEGEMA